MFIPVEVGADRLAGLVVEDAVNRSADFLADGNAGFRDEHIPVGSRADGVAGFDIGHGGRHAERDEHFVPVLQPDGNEGGIGRADFGILNAHVTCQEARAIDAALLEFALFANLVNDLLPLRFIRDAVFRDDIDALVAILAHEIQVELSRHVIGLGGVMGGFEFGQAAPFVIRIPALGLNDLFGQEDLPAAIGIHVFPGDQHAGLDGDPGQGDEAGGGAGRG